jgi:GTPase Era involved in 16S rRNA processing
MSNDRKKVSCLVYGKLNQGKSAVLSTFLPDDQIAVGEESGTTKKTRDLPPKWSRSLLMQDAPGLQHADEVVSDLKKTETLLASSDEITERLLQNEKYDKVGDEQDLEVIKGIKKADFLLLVFNADDPLSKEDKRIIETAKLWRKPFGVVLNNGLGSKEEAKEVFKEVEVLLAHPPRIFDAHTGGVNSHEQRKCLLKYLIDISELCEREDLSSTLKECKKDLEFYWENSFQKIADTIVSGLKECMNHTQLYEEEEDKTGKRKKYNDKLEKIRKKVFKSIRNKLHHNKFGVILAEMDDSKEWLDWKRELELSWWSLLGKCYRKHPRFGPIFARKHGKRREEFARKFLADCIAVFRKYAKHPHAKRDGIKKEVDKNTTLEIAGFSPEASDDHPCFWTKEDLDKLSKFFNSKGKKRKDLINLLKEKLLKSLEV